jgi:hypothetical protein
MWALVHRPAPFSLASLLSPVWPQLKQLEAPPAKKQLPPTARPPLDLLSPPLTPAISPQSSVADLRALSTEPLPMLTKPTYRVDTSTNIFNYDCGL